MKTKLRQAKGFTIIEVVIVLAIAALIMLIVFLAVPALQRGQRNNGRRSDVGRIAAAVVDYTTNNPNNPINSAGGCGALVNNIGTTNQVTLPPLTGASPNQTCSNGTVTAGGLITATSSAGANAMYILTPSGNITTKPAANTNEVILVMNSQCDTNNLGQTVNYSAGSNSVAVMYTVEGGSGSSWACNNAQ